MERYANLTRGQIRLAAARSRAYQLIQSKKKPYALISAWNDERDYAENQAAMSQLRNDLKKAGPEHGVTPMGPHEMIGGWEEPTQEAKDQGMGWKEAKAKGMVEPTHERSYLVFKPEEMDQKTFEDIILRLGQKYGQWAVVLAEGPEDSKLQEAKPGGEVFEPHMGKVHWGQVGEGYSLTPKGDPWAIGKREQMVTPSQEQRKDWWSKKPKDWKRELRGY